MSQQLPTRVPAVIDRLLTGLAADVALDGVQILDGAALSMDQVEDDSICVAPATADSPGMFVTVTEETGLGRVAYIEQVEVVMSVQSYGGDAAAKPRRDRCSDLLAAVKGYIDDHQVEDGAWGSASLGPEFSWHPIQSPGGATCAVGFTLVFRSPI